MGPESDLLFLNSFAVGLVATWKPPFGKGTPALGRLFLSIFLFVIWPISCILGYSLTPALSDNNLRFLGIPGTFEFSLCNSHKVDRCGPVSHIFWASYHVWINIHSDPIFILY